MKKIILLLVLAAPLHAQTRVLVGGEAGSSFGNLYAGPVVAVEAPIGKRFEFDARESFSPLEEHVNLGTGWANSASVGGIVWLAKPVGVNANVEYSNYRTNIAKHAWYESSGVTFRKAVDFMPIRFTFDYLREFRNGIDATGTESGRLQAGQFNMDMRIRCAGAVCYRVQFDFKVGHVLTQSNPVCDGSYGGAISCARTGVSSGAFSSAILVEWPRRRATEEEAF